MTQDDISRHQLKIPPRPAVLRERQDYRRQARWWWLEALRGYPSSEDSRRYSENMRWAVELAGIYGPGTWLELIVRRGVPNPEA